jgi:hypothetical protein
LYVTAAFAVSLGLGAASSLFAREPVELRVQATRRELLLGGDLLTTFPPVALLWGVGNGLGPGLSLLIDLGPIFTIF